MSRKDHPIFGTNIGLSRMLKESGNDNDELRHTLNDLSSELRYLRIGQARIEKTLDVIGKAVVALHKLRERT